MANTHRTLHLDDLSLAVIPAGIIVLRDDRLEKSWKVNISSFFLGRFPLTQKLYRAVMGFDPSVSRGDEFPVENVSWYDAVRFCNRLSENLGLSPFYENTNDGDEVSIVPNSEGIRLPTEAEWEFSCRAGSSQARYGVLDEIAWYRGVCTTCWGTPGSGVGINMTKMFMAIIAFLEAVAGQIQKEAAW